MFSLSQVFIVFYQPDRSCIGFFLDYLWLICMSSFVMANIPKDFFVSKLFRPQSAKVLALQHPKLGTERGVATRLGGE